MIDRGLPYSQNTQTFKHGIHPEENKYYTQNKPIERMPFSEDYILPLSQHIGAPAVEVVRKGERVLRGQLIAKPSGYVSVAIHSPVEGVVRDIGLFPGPGGLEQKAIRIKTDLYSSQQFSVIKVPDPDDCDFETFIMEVQKAGMVGLGGAAFPAHVKFNIPKEKKCSYIMLNGCECEPYLTSDDRLMVEHAEELLDGLLILNRFIKAEHLIIAVETNKRKAIETLNSHIDSRNLPVVVYPLKTKYPQGAEKMMITSILGKEVPSGKLPLDLGVLVSNVGTIVALSDYFRKGIPLVERVITVTGNAIRRPANARVSIGTHMGELLSWCEGLDEGVDNLVLGGPMMGSVQKIFDVPVVKGTSGILALKNPVAQLQEYNCIRCGYCVDACPLFLNPARLGMMARKGLWDEMEENHLLDCFECGSCSYVCPSSIPLVQSFRAAKGILKERKNKLTADA